MIHHTPTATYFNYRPLDAATGLDHDPGKEDTAMGFDRSAPTRADLARGRRRLCFRKETSWSTVMMPRGVPPGEAALMTTPRHGNRQTVTRFADSRCSTADRREVIRLCRVSRSDFMTSTIQPPLLARAWKIAVGDPREEPRGR